MIPELPAPVHAEQLYEIVFLKRVFEDTFLTRNVFIIKAIHAYFVKSLNSRAEHKASTLIPTPSSPQNQCPGSVLINNLPRDPSAVAPERVGQL